MISLSAVAARNYGSRCRIHGSAPEGVSIGTHCHGGPEARKEP
jgi:hypothetical protein